MSPASLCKRFAADRSGVIAVVFSLTLLPLLMGVGAAVDYSRATAARTDLQSAVDAAVLAVGRVAIETGRTNNTVQARQAFDAGFQRGDGTTVTRFAVTQNLEKIVVDVDARIPLAFARLLRIDHIDVNARAEVPLDKVTLEVALVLDNTGSMGSASKLVYLQQAANQLITKLENATVVNFTSYVALVPFTTQVRLFEGDLWAALPGVRLNHTKDAAEPALQVTLPWRGCIADRDQPNDAQGYETSDGVPLNTGAPGTLLPAVRCEREGLRPLVPLTRDFTTLHTRVNAMVADGDTNGTVGLAAGLALLTPDLGAGLVTGARPPARLIRKHMIFLTDGDNTKNRWIADSAQKAQVDLRTAQICTEIKQSSLNITLHTIHLVNGNATLLRNCATTPDRYHFVAAPADLNGVFDEIAAEMLSLRLSY
jgi:Flp pilus assembly protein TadG